MTDLLFESLKPEVEKGQKVSGKTLGRTGPFTTTEDNVCVVGSLLKASYPDNLCSEFYVGLADGFEGNELTLDPPEFGCSTDLSVSPEYYRGVEVGEKFYSLCPGCEA